MLMKYENLKKIFSVAYISLLLSCACVCAKPSQYETDAETLCSLYDPGDWNDLQKEATGYEIYQNILAGIEKGIISKEVKEISIGYKGTDFNS